MSTLLLLLTFHLVRIMTASAAGRNRWLVSSIVLRRERETRSITMQTGVCRRMSENFSSFFSDFSREEMADRYRGRDNAVYVRTGVDRRAVVNRSDGNWKFISLIIFFRRRSPVGLPCNSKSYYIVANGLFIDLLFQHQSGYSTGRLGKQRCCVSVYRRQ